MSVSAVVKKDVTKSVKKSQPTILLVDDERRVLSSLTRCLARLGVNLVDYSCPQQALAYAANNRPDLVISDQRMPAMQGSKLLSEIKALWPDIQTIILSGYSDLESLSEAFNRRVIDRFISKPWDNSELRMIVTAALREQGLLTSRNPAKEAQIATDFHGMLSADKTMSLLYSRINKCARANIPIFITGETGTGKELVARACHLESPRRTQPFIAMNCANLNDQLVESQLFGHRRGAFTGATEEQPGLCAAAGQGTLFLDEVTSLTLPLQAKLLRVIQEREFTPVGSYQPQPFSAQLLTASSTTLAEAVERGEFREDLYYRLNVIPLRLPPLKDRGEDSILLAEHFLQYFGKLEKKPLGCFSDDAREFIRQYSWPGNVRQLENLIHSLVVLTDQRVIDRAMLQTALESDSSNTQNSVSKTRPSKTAGENAVMPLWLVEKNTIENAIASCGGNVPRAAALLEVSPSTIYRKQKQGKVTYN